MNKNFSEYLQLISDYLVDYKDNDSGMISSASDDSRSCAANSLFCAKKGLQFDAHNFVEDALANGAKAVFSERPLQLPPEISWALVNNADIAFAKVAEFSHNYPAQAMKVLGITGTNGKTTVAYLLQAILKKAAYHTALLGTVQYDLGDGKAIVAERTTPTAFELQKLFSKMKENKVDFAVMEVSSHALAQNRLGSTKLHVGIFTNLSRDHLDYHNSFEEYYRCKRKLFAELLQDEAAIIINIDDQWGMKLFEEMKEKNAFAFSLKNNHKANVQIKNIVLTANSSTFAVNFQDECWQLSSPLVGEFNVYNLAAAACVSKALGINKNTVVDALHTCHGAPGRLQGFESKQGFSVFVDYAHTDDALKNVLSALKPICKGKIFVVFGCGGNRDKSKRPLMAKAAEKIADQIIVTSDNPRCENPQEIINHIMQGFENKNKVIVEENREIAIKKAMQNARKGDIVLIAGKGHEEYQEIMNKRIYFSDKDMVEKYLNE